MVILVFQACMVILVFLYTDHFLYQFSPFSQQFIESEREKLYIFFSLNNLYFFWDVIHITAHVVTRISHADNTLSLL